MTPTAVGLSMFGGMLLLMALRVPIAAAMFVPGALGYWVMTNDIALLNQLKGSAVARLTVYDLSVIPLFLLMGQFATQGGLSRALFQASSVTSPASTRRRLILPETRTIRRLRGRATAAPPDRSCSARRRSS